MKVMFLGTLFKTEGASPQISEQCPREGYGCASPQPPPQQGFVKESHSPR